MIRGFVEASKQPNNPVNEVCREMDWGLVFTSEDIDLLDLFLSLMTPMEFLFVRLNSDKETTLHLCYPVVQVTPPLRFSAVKLKFPGAPSKTGPTHH